MNPEERLSQMLDQKKLPHALLFTGRGTCEKERVAYAFALRIVGNGDNVKTHPDIHLYFPEGKTGIHPVSNVRTMMNEAALAPFQSPWKVFIIQEAERMLPTSSNAFLKTLEEPPEHTLFILLSAHPERMLPTLLSRCQSVEFPSVYQLKEHPLLDVLARTRSLEGLEFTDQDALLDTIYHWFRDRYLLEIGATQSLTFPTRIDHIKNTPLLSLDYIEKHLINTRRALECAVKPTTCIEALLLQFFNCTK